MYTSSCSICGKGFDHRFPTQHVCEACKNRPCEICGRPFKRVDPYDQKYCSKECRSAAKRDPERNKAWTAKRQATCEERYGVHNVSKLDNVRKKISDNRHSEDFKNKIRKTSLEKYGVEHYQSAPEVKEKVRQGFLIKHGVDNISKLDSIRKKISDRLKDPEVRAKYRETSMQHYGLPHPHMDPEVKAKTERTMMEHFGVPYYVMLPEYRSAQATHQVSIVNQAVAEAIKERCNKDVEYEFRLGRKFYDIKIKDTNILIEVDPSYTHSDLPNHWADGLPADYHLEKTQLAEENGYRCIHIFDWDNLDKIVNMFIDPKIIYARQCELKRFDPKQATEFIDSNHLQGDARGAKYCYGLMHDGELVSAMTFGVPRYNKHYAWELLRLCTATGYRVVGGASKMFSKFLSDANPESILSYCDKSKFTGSVYSKIGMTFHHLSSPAKVWSKENKYITDNLLRQRGFDQIFGTDYGKGTSNEELMIDHDWRSVYDCGQMVFEWKR